MKSAVRRFRIFIFSSLVTFGLCLLFMFGLNVAFDPLHILKKPSEMDVYDRESRFAMPGMIRFNDSVHAIVGTSVIQDFQEGYYEGKTGEKISRYFLTGGTGYEQRRMVETLLSSKTPPKRVIWGLDPVSFTGPLDNIRWAQFPEHLFQKNPSIFEYSFSFQTFHRLLRQLPDRFYLKNRFFSEDTRFRPSAGELAVGRDRVFRSYCGNSYQKRLGRLREFDFSTQKAQIDANLLSVLRDHPDTEFILFFPPYSLMLFAEYKQTKILENIFDFRARIFEDVRTLKNVTLYDFQNDLSKVLRFEDFRDAVHYGPEIMKGMSDDFISGRNKVIASSDIQRGNSVIQNALRNDIWNAAYSYCEEQNIPITSLKN